jgi:large subunit ribosomal protein L23
MALFSRSKKEEPTKVVDSKKEEQKDTKKEVVAKDAQVSKARPTDRNLSSVLIKPRITEKAVKMGEKNVYTFVVRANATKFDVRDAVISLFKVTPVKVNIVNKSPRQYKSRSKNRVMTEKGMKKAYVYLKAGDSIELA